MAWGAPNAGGSAEEELTGVIKAQVEIRLDRYLMMFVKQRWREELGIISKLVVTGLMYYCIYMNSHELTFLTLDG